MVNVMPLFRLISITIILNGKRVANTLEKDTGGDLAFLSIYNTIVRKK